MVLRKILGCFIGGLWVIFCGIKDEVLTVWVGIRWVVLLMFTICGHFSSLLFCCSSIFLMRYSFSKNRFALLVLFCTGSLVLLGFASRSPFGSSVVEKIQSASWRLMGSGLEVGADSNSGIKSALGSSNTPKAETTKELAALRAEVAVLKTQLAELQSVESLRTTLPEYSALVQPVKNLGPLGNFRRELLWVKLSPGVSLQVGQTIIGSQGYLGRVDELQETLGKPAYATVQLLTDVESQVGARNERTQELGVVRYSEALEAVIFQLGTSAPTVKVGDKIVTSGLRGSTILEGLPLGTVSLLTTDQRGERVAVLELAQKSTTDSVVFALRSGSTNWAGTP